MKRYRNVDGNSGVVAYELHENAIDVEFTNRSAYRYDHRKPGAEHVRTMKALAAQGRGLSTYISQHVRDNYALKLR